MRRAIGPQPRPRRAPGRHAAAAGAAGAVLPLLVLLLPVLLAIGALVIDGGRLQLGRQQLRHAAEAAALAGVQSVDWVALAAGQAALDSGAATERAAAVARANLRLAFGDTAGEGVVTISVQNGAPGPSVQVEVMQPVRLLVWPGAQVTLTGQAAAGLVPKYRPKW